jgi:hypothetical protein
MLIGTLFFLPTWIVQYPVDCSPSAPMAQI